MKLAESRSPVTKNLDVSNETTEKLGDNIRESNLEINDLKTLPNSPNFSVSMRQMLGSLWNSRNSLKIFQDEFGQAKILGISIQLSGDDKIKEMILFMI